MSEKDLLTSLTEYLESPEGKASTKAWMEKCVREDYIDKQHYDRLEKRGPRFFDEFVTKVLQKYNSKKYRDRWFDRGIEPQETLLYFLHDYASEKGRECTDEEYEKYSGTFTADIVYCNGWYFELLHGQGSYVYAFKE